ncbi:unnamed protein product, partial [Acidithrix sp. C25]
VRLIGIDSSKIGFGSPPFNIHSKKGGQVLMVEDFFDVGVFRF